MIHFVFGDINIDLLKTDLNSNAFIDTVSAQSYLPFITIPTHYSNCNNIDDSIIDHVWSNSGLSLSSGVFPVCITDHYPIFLTISTPISRNLIYKTFRDHSHENISKFKVELGNFLINFDRYRNMDVNFRCNYFMKQLYHLYDTCCPVKRKLISYKRYLKPWLTDGLLNCIKHKHKLFRDYKCGKTPFKQ